MKSISHFKKPKTLSYYWGRKVGHLEAVKAYEISLELILDKLSWADLVINTPSIEHSSHKIKNRKPNKHCELWLEIIFRSECNGCSMFSSLWLLHSLQMLYRMHLQYFMSNPFEIPPRVLCPSGQSIPY